MSTIKLKKWNSAALLKNDEDIALFKEACLEEAGGDAAFISKTLATITRAKDMMQFASEHNAEPEFLRSKT